MTTTTLVLEVLHLALCGVGLMLGSVMLAQHVTDLLFVYRTRANFDKPIQTWERVSVSVALLFLIGVRMTIALILWQFTPVSMRGANFEHVVTIMGLVESSGLVGICVVRWHARLLLRRRWATGGAGNPEVSSTL